VHRYRSAIVFVLTVAALLAACHRVEEVPLGSAPDASSTDTDSDSDSDVDSDTDIDADTDSDTDIDSDTGSGTGSDTDSSSDTATCPFDCISETLCDLVGGEVHDEWTCEGVNICCDQDPLEPEWTLPDTNQTLCTDFDEEWIWVDCDAIDDGAWLYGQDGHYQSAARQQSYDIGDGSVIDEVTLLEWEQCVAGLSGDDCTDGAALTGPWEGGVYYCDTLDLGGHDDWRLPTALELMWLTDLEASSSAINPDAFPAVPWSNGFWSSDEYLCEFMCWGTCYFIFSYWNTGSGPSLSQADWAAYTHGRCVRGEPPSMASFTSSIVAGDRVVDHYPTELTWQGCVAGLSGDDCESGEVDEFAWGDGLAHCETLEWAGHDDWRMPDQNELATLLNLDACDPAVYDEFGVSGFDESLWTSTTVAAEQYRAKMINFDHGELWSTVKYGLGRVICVRGGP